MKNFKLLLLIFSCQGAMAQELGLSLGGNVSSLNFQTDQGYKIESIRGLPGSLATIQYGINLTKQSPASKPSNAWDLLALMEVGYKSAKLKDETSTVQSTWTMHYLGSGVGIKALRASKGVLNPYVKIGVIYDLLLSGTQIFGYEQYDLKEQIRSKNFGLSGETGIAYSTSNESYITLGLGYSKGITNLDKDHGEKATLCQWQIKIAAIFNSPVGKKKRRK